MGQNETLPFSLILQKKIPLTPVIKIAHFCNVMSIDMTLQKWATLKVDVYRENLRFCRIKLKCCSWLYNKR